LGLEEAEENNNLMHGHW